jgi:hypothetical protein
MFVVILFMVLATALLSWSWVKGIDYMKENHPDYKGEDFLGDDFVHTASGRDLWDEYEEDNAHYEGDF